MFRRSRPTPRSPGSAIDAARRWRTAPGGRRPESELMEETLNASAPGDAADTAAAPPPRRLEIWLPIVIVAVDQLTKALVRATVPLHESVTVIPGLIDFTHVRNTGAAFGILNLAEFPF